MKRETESAIRAPHRSIRLAAAGAALLLSGSACVADNQVGLDLKGAPDGGGAGVVTDPSSQAAPQAFALSADDSCDQVAVVLGPVTGPIATSVKMLDPRDGAQVRVIQQTPAAPNMLLSHASGVVAASDGSTVWLFDSAGRALRSIPQLFPTIAIALSADAAVLVTSTIGDGGGQGGAAIHRFEVATGAEIMPAFVLPPPDGGAAWMSSLAISPDGATIAASGAPSTHVWRASDGALLAEIPGPASYVALSATGELAVAGETNGAGETGVTTFYSLAGEQQGQYPASGRLAYSADGTKLAIATTVYVTYDPPGYPFRVKILDRTRGTEAATFFDDQDPVIPGGKATIFVGVAFVEQDTAVAVGFSNRRVTVFGASDGLPIWSRVLEP